MTDKFSTVKDVLMYKFYIDDMSPDNNSIKNVKRFFLSKYSLKSSAGIY